VRARIFLTVTIFDKAEVDTLTTPPDPKKGHLNDVREGNSRAISRVKWLGRKSDPGMTLRSYVDGSLDPAPCFSLFSRASSRPLITIPARTRPL
jgi:hypothetical protein